MDGNTVPKTMFQPVHPFPTSDIFVYHRQHLFAQQLSPAAITAEAHPIYTRQDRTYFEGVHFHPFPFSVSHLVRSEFL